MQRVPPQTAPLEWKPGQVLPVSTRRSTMRIFATLAVTAVMGLVGCQNTTTTTTGDATSPKLSNSDLEKSIKAQLVSDPRVAKVDVDADADKNQVTLKGTVNSEQARTAA